MFVLLVLAAISADGQRFDSFGTEFDSADKGNRAWRTVPEWAKDSLALKSKEGRTQAQRALTGIAARHMNRTHVLSTADMQALRVAGMNLLTKGGDAESRRNGAEVLVVVADESCRKALMEAATTKFTDSNFSGLRYSATRALGHMKSDTCVPTLFRVLTEDLMIGNRLEAAKALGHLRTKTAIKALESAHAMKGGDETTREAVGQMLDKIESGKE